MAILYRIAGSLATLSAFGSFGIIISALLISKLRENPHTLVVFLALSDFMLSLKFIATALYPGSASLQNIYEICMLQAGWAQFWALASVSWNAIISLNLIIKLKSPFTNSAGYEKYYHVWVWGLSSLTTAALVMTQSFGKSGDGTCWFPEYSQPYYKLLFFAPLLVYFGISFASLVVYLQRLKTLGNDRRVAFRMTLYVFIFIMFWTGPLVHRFIQIFYPDDVLNDDNGILVYIDVVSITSQGAINALVWLTSPTFFVQFREQILERYFSCFLTKDKRIPLMPKFLEDTLQDDSVDINQIDSWMRKNIINCILIGVNSSFDSVADVKGQLDLAAFQTVVVHEHRQVELTGLDAGKRQVVVTSTAKSSNIKVRGKKKDKLLLDEEYDEKTVKNNSPKLVNNSPKHFNVPERKNSGGSASGSPAVQTPKQDEKMPLLGRANSQQQKVLDTSNNKRSSTIDFQFYDYAPLAFHHIRTMNGISLEDYKKSLDPETFMAKLSDQKFSEGRSGSFFVFSPDKKFIIKTINKAESELLVSILPRLYKYLSRNPESLIIRFYGCCTMELEGIEPIRLVVMENVFCTDLKIHEKYDLKGSWVHRQVGKKHELDRSVLGMDLDLNRQLHLSQHVRSQLNYIIECDVEFLKSVSIMDYSLLLGFHFTDREDSPYFQRAGVNINNVNVNNTNIEENSNNSNNNVVEDDNSEAVNIPEEKPLLNNNNTEEEQSPATSTHRGRKDSIIKQMQQKLAIPLRDTSKSPRPLLRSHHGGVASIDGKEIYLLGLIDVLQLYDKNKKMERCCKVYFLRKDKEGISVQPPKRYAQRFLSNITALFDSKKPENNTDVTISLEDSEVAINSGRSTKSGSARTERKNKNAVVQEEDVV